MQFLTLTGKTAEEIVEELKEHLPAGAYSAIPHATYLTEIDPAYLREKLTEVFGIAGFGWWFDYGEDDLITWTEQRNNKTHFFAYFKRFEFRYRYREEEDGEVKVSRAILSSGGSDNRAPGDAVEGAITNAIGKSAKKLLFQLDVYKGLLTHNDFEGNGRQSKQVGMKPGGRQAKPSRKGSPVTAGPTFVRDVLAIRANALADPSEIGPTEFWTLARIMLPDDKETADFLHANADTWADALIELIDKFGGPEVDKALELSKNAIDAGELEAKLVDEVLKLKRDVPGG